VEINTNKTEKQFIELLERIAKTPVSELADMAQPGGPVSYSPTGNMAGIVDNFSPSPPKMQWAGDLFKRMIGDQNFQKMTPAVKAWTVRDLMEKVNGLEAKTRTALGSPIDISESLKNGDLALGADKAAKDLK